MFIGKAPCRDVGGTVPTPADVLVCWATDSHPHHNEYLTSVNQPLQTSAVMSSLHPWQPEGSTV